MSISGNKDIDREILLTLPDKDLIKTCSLNKYLFYSVCDDNFFYRKLLISYPNALKYYCIAYYKECNYKRYYLYTLCCVLKLGEEFNYSFISGDPITQYKIFKRCKNDDQELLILASMHGEIELLKESIKRGVNIGERSEMALRLASANGYLEIVKYLVKLGADIHAFNDDTLNAASEKGHLEVVKYLESLY